MTRESTEMIQNVHVVTISSGIVWKKYFDVRQKVILLIIMGSALLLSTGGTHLNLFAIWNILPCATHLVLAELAYTSCYITYS